MSSLVLPLPWHNQSAEYIRHKYIYQYCCDKCCNQYATNRPVDENGNEIVYGSIGRVLTQGKSIAVDPNVIPYDTKVVINGNEYIAHDTGGAIKGNRIDVYFENHQDALDFGVQQSEVFIYNN